MKTRVIILMILICAIKLCAKTQGIGQGNLGVSLMEINNMQQIRDALDYYGYDEVKNSPQQVVFVKNNNAEICLVLDPALQGEPSSIKQIKIKRAENKAKIEQQLKSCGYNRVKTIPAVDASGIYYRKNEKYCIIGSDVLIFFRRPVEQATTQYDNNI